jgi:hypothetical protein
MKTKEEYNYNTLEKRGKAKTNDGGHYVQQI